jgi:hypothetical protein
MSCTTDKGYSFSSPEQAISEYQKFAQNLSQITDAILPKFSNIRKRN